MSTQRRLGLLQCGHAPEALQSTHPDYDGLFKVLLGPDRFDYRTFRVVDGELPASIDEADAWLITGSRHGVYEDHDWIAPLEAHVRAVHEAGQPLVGICFGHQLLAQALGGRVEKFVGGWSVGRVEYTVDEVFGTTSAPLLAFHQDQVIEPPPGACVVGSSSFCRYAALMMGERTLGLQPHPEFDDAFLHDLLEARGDILPKDILDTAGAGLGQPLSRQAVGEAMARFLSS